MPARQSGLQRQQCIGAISAFVDSIDSQIILRMIRESKMGPKSAGLPSPLYEGPLPRAKNCSGYMSH